MPAKPAMRPMVGIVVLVAIFALLIFGRELVGKRELPSGDIPIPVSNAIPGSEVTIRLPKGEIKAIIANTPELRALGLGQRESLGKNEGMLFVFDEPGMRGFWMKDMKFAIDIVWIEGGKVQGIAKNVTPDTFPRAFMPPKPVTYVLELNSGAADAFGLATGTEIMF